MALHGDIRINGNMLGEWQARRTQHLVHENAVHEYEWRVVTIDGTDKRGLVLHRYSDGAVKLAALVLHEALGLD